MTQKLGHMLPQSKIKIAILKNNKTNLMTITMNYVGTMIQKWKMMKMRMKRMMKRIM